MVHDKRHQAIDDIAAVGKMNSELGKIEPGGKVGTIARGFYDLPAAGQVPYGF